MSMSVFLSILKLQNLQHWIISECCVCVLACTSQPETFSEKKKYPQAQTACVLHASSQGFTALQAFSAVTLIEQHLCNAFLFLQSSASVEDDLEQRQ